MATPTADKLKLYYPGKYIAADGGTLFSGTCGTDSGTTIIHDSALEGTDDYYNDAVGWMTDGSSAYTFFHVRDYDGTTNQMTLSKSLPVSASSGEHFTLFLGGNYRSTSELFGMKAGGQFPEFTAPSLTNINGAGTAVTIKNVSYLCGEGTLTLDFNGTDSTLRIKAPGDSEYGVAVDISTDLSNQIFFAEDGQKYIIADTCGTVISGTDVSDTLVLSNGESTFFPDIEGYESSSGKTRYSLMVIKNTDSSGTMVDLSAYIYEPTGTSGTLVGSFDNTSSGAFVVSEYSDWPTASFWVENSTENDLAYVKYRSAGTCYTLSAGTGLRGYTASASWSNGDNVDVYPDIDIGLDAPSSDQFENPTSGTTAPSGITFSAPMASGTLSIGDFAPSQLYGIWVRETILDGHRAKSNVTNQILFQWS